MNNKNIKNLLIIGCNIYKFCRSLITRDLLIFCSLVSFTICLIAVSLHWIKAVNDAMTAGGLFFTFVFSVWQYTDNIREKNCKTVQTVKNELEERIDNIVTQFTKALNDIKNNSEKEDDKHNIEIDKINDNLAKVENDFKLKLSNIQTELDNVKEQLKYHLNSFGHNKTIEQQQEIIKQLADVNAMVTVSSEYAETLQAVKNLAKNVKRLEDEIKKLKTQEAL